MKRQKGLTLIELLLVLAIMGIVSAIVIPASLSYRQKTRVGRDLQAKHPEVVSIIKIEHNDAYDYNVVTVQNNDGSVSVHTLYGESNDATQKIAGGELSKHPEAKSINVKRVDSTNYVVTIENYDGFRYSYAIR